MQRLETEGLDVLQHVSWIHLLLLDILPMAVVSVTVTGCLNRK